jgi:hypothetical protein
VVAEEGERVCANEADPLTAWPPGSVVVAVLLAFPGTTVIAALRVIVAPLAVVRTCCLSHAPGAVLVSVEVNVSFFPFERVIVPPDE